ncbi:hypothetical protein Tco_1414984 [Tanacetum coccineum]
MSLSIEARIAEYATAPAPPSPPPSPLSPWSPLLPQIPTTTTTSTIITIFTTTCTHIITVTIITTTTTTSLTVHTTTNRPYEVGESSTTAPRPTRGHRADYRFIGTTDAEIRRRRVEEVGYGISDVWVDPTEAVEEVAPTTLEGINARVTELAVVQEQDTQDVYAVIEDTQDRQTQLFQRVDGLVEDRQFYYETARLLDWEALDLYSDAGLPYRLTGVTDDDIDCIGFITTGINNMPPRRSSATARAAAVARVVAAAAAATPMTAAAVEQLIEARVSAELDNHETLRNSTNGQGDGSHNSDTRIRGTVLTPCTDVMSYTLRFQELALICRRMFHEESDEVEIYVGGLPDMIRGNVMSYQPKTMEKAIKFANDQMDQKVLTIAERQAEQKRKLEFNAGNNQGHQQ